MTDRRARLRRWRSGIRPRIVVWYLVLFAVSLAIALLTIRQILLVQFDKEVETALTQEAEEFRLAVQGAEAGTSLRDSFSTFLSQNFPAEQEVFVAIVGGELYGTVPNARAAPVARPDLIEAWSQLTDATFGESATDDGHRRWLAVPVLRDGEVRGTFVITYAVAEEQDAITQALWIMAAVSGAVLILASILAWATAGRVLAPLRHLTRTARQISEDNLAERIPVDGDDEVAELTETLNAMFDRLDAAFTQQRDFLNDASHELRTPITIVRGHLELLPENREERNEVVTVCLDELDRMARHVRDLLTLAKAEQPDFLRLRRTDIASLTDGLEALGQGLDADRRWRIEQLAPIVIAADPDRITQAMVNLMANAAQHTPSGSEIRLGSGVAGREVRLWVADRGAGIDPADQARVFDRFARGRRSASQRTEGSGLGLAIVATVAEAHGGRVELESAPGEGSLFTIVLPIGDADPTDTETDPMDIEASADTTVTQPIGAGPNDTQPIIAAETPTQEIVQP